MDARRVVHASRPEDWLEREWLVTNGLGGYAFGTLAGVPTRGYHALLVAAHPPPHGREIALQHVIEEVLLDGQRIALSGLDRTDGPAPWPALAHLESFALELGLPVWRWRIGLALLERRVAMVHGANVVLVCYRLIEGEAATLELQPWLQPRGQDASLADPVGPLVASADGDRLRVMSARGRAFEMRAVGGSAETVALETWQVRRRIEPTRGYVGEGPLAAPGRLRLELVAGRDSYFVASAEPAGTLPIDPALELEREQARRRALLELAPPGRECGAAAELVLAADAFVVRPLRSGFPAARTVIAGYPWFTDWGRDTMISLEGLTLCTGRPELTAAILRAFASHMRDGLVPNLFPEGSSEGLYHTADATLWFIHAVGRYLARTGDRALLDALLPKLSEIIERHLAGTRFGIGVDGSDGLLRQGAPGYQLTWMDAKVGDWVVTPRRGKAVEINALWYQALTLVAGWRGDAALEAEAARVRRSFNARFWCAERSHLFDVVDGENGDDASLRPNQLFALSLPHPVLDRERWGAVVNAVQRSLWTPHGLRTLSPADPRYRGIHQGDVRTRDAAYHQGTAWAWLVGAYVDARLAVEPGARAAVRSELQPLLAHLGEAGVGWVSEVFSGDPPHAAEGCIAQAWSVAELLRAWERTASV